MIPVVIDGQDNPIFKTRKVETFPAKASLDGCLLYVCESTAEDRGRSYKLTAGRAVIGRDGDCQLVLRDDSVSRKHAQFSITEEGILVEDLGSTNGTTYLGKRIERATLILGSRVYLGKCGIDLLPLSQAGLPLSERTGYGELVGGSLSMRRLYALLETLEKSDAPALITGETGTGKELVARALHRKSPRAKKPFVIIDCSTVSRELVESELFGHRQGAFTGAIADRAGAFEEADGGTVFLDELDVLPLELQPKLLRVLETGQVRRLGETAYRPVNVRVIAASKRELSRAVEEGTFRQDLFFRVAVIIIRLAPLRERIEDIPMLAAHLADQIRPGSSARLPPQVLEAMMNYDWPGNVRELRNVVQRVLTLGVLGLGVDREFFGASPNRFPPEAEERISFKLDEHLPQFRAARDRVLSEFERSYLTVLWAQSGHNLSAAARRAGLDRKYLRELLRKHGLV